MRQKLPDIKAGDTLSYAFTCQLPTGLWTATCQVRTSNPPYQLLADAAVTLSLPVNGVSTVAVYVAAAQTKSWPAGLQELDIRFSDSGGAVIYTDSIVLPVLRSITLPLAL